jgi:hypothetical protein
MSEVMTERERIEATLRNEPCDKIPWATRLDIWHTASLRSGRLPEEFKGMDLMEIHHQLGIARQHYALVTGKRLNGVEITVEFNGEVIRQDKDPQMDFPLPRNYVPNDKPGQTLIFFKTPVGQSFVRFLTTETTIKEAELPYPVERIIKNDNDFEVVKWILNHTETVPFFGQFEKMEALIGDFGFTIPLIGRIPFQQIMLDFMGEEHTIYTLVDNKPQIDYLMDILSEQARESVQLGLELPSPVIEFVDNLEGMITSPSFFQTYCIPFYQECADMVHGHGRFLGSHMDGNMKPLVNLIPDCGVDIVESYSPAPLTPLTFDESWKKWSDKVLMWGVIPSPIFEPHVSEADFEQWLEAMFNTLGGNRRIILGIGDQAIGQTLTDRIRRVSELLGREVG